MKFGKYFEHELASSAIPKEWVESAIQYKQLKKQIHRFAQELCYVGLTKDIVAQVLEVSDEDKDITLGHIEASDGQYSFYFDVEISGLDLERPKAEYVFLQNKRYTKPVFVVYLGIDPESLNIREKLAHFIENSEEKLTDLDIKNESTKLLRSRNNIKFSVCLKEDDVFFQTIFTELSKLKQVKESHEKEMVDKINAIATTIGELSSPDKRRTDRDIWREIFELYLENRIFYRTDDVHGERTGQEAQKRLEMFSQDVAASDLVRKFKKKQSKATFNAFYQLNISLINSLKYHELNKTAVTKILKKFDKQTALTVKGRMPLLLSYEPFISDSFILKMYSAISERLISIIPQLDDFNCPVCFTIAYRPIRLRCNHVYCVQCLILLQRQQKNECPVCRTPSVLEATSGNLDLKLQEYMKKYFPKEVKLKQKERLKMIEAEAYHRAYTKAKYGLEGCVLQ